MEIVEQHLSEVEISTLASLRESRWNYVATSGMVIGNVFTCPVLVSTEGHVLEFQIEDNEDLVEGYYETLTKARIRPVQVNVEEVTLSGKLLVQGRGEVCRNIFLIHEILTKFRNGKPVAVMSSHAGAVFELERCWIAVQRRGFHGFDYVINQSTNVDELVFFNSEGEFPQNLIVNYEFDRKLTLLT